MGIKRSVYFSELKIKDDVGSEVSYNDLVTLFNSFKQRALSREHLPRIGQDLALAVLVSDANSINGVLTFADKNPRQYTIKDASISPDDLLNLNGTSLAFVAYFKIVSIRGNKVICFVKDIHGPTHAHLNIFLKDRKLQSNNSIKKIDFQYLTKEQGHSGLDPEAGLLELRLKYKTPVSNALMELNGNIFKANELYKEIGPAEITLVLKASNRLNDRTIPLHIKLKNAFKFKRKLEETDSIEDLDSFIIKRSGGLGKIESIDLLENHIRQEIELPSDPNENVETVFSQMFEKISVALDDKRQDIENYFLPLKGQTR